MAEKKITELNEATSISNNDWLVMVDVANDETKKIHAGEVGGNIPIQDTAPQDPEENDLWIDTSSNNDLKYYNGSSWELVSGEIAGDTFPIGAMIPFGSTTAPTNWLVCDGSAVSRTTYSELFAIIGTSYGAGDGSTTFNLPNKKGRTSVGYDSTQTEFNAIGKTGGSKYLQKHKHTEIDWLADTNYPLSLNTGGTGGYAITNWSSGVGTGRIGTNEAGTGESGNLQPYETDCWIIKAKQSIGVVAEVENSSSNSQTNVYSCDYVNKKTGVELWTNQYPTNDFSAQTIQLSLSGYKVITFFYTRWSGDKILSTTICFENLTTNTELNYSDYDSGNVRSWNRNVTIKTTEVQFENNTINGSVANSGLIPYKIIGYK